MSLLNTITTGKQMKSPIVTLYGIEGIGKSTWGACAPKPIFIDTEGGLGELECARFPQAKSFDDVVQQLKALLNEEHDYQTVCIDSADWLERLIWDRVCCDYGVRSISKADGGYGKGYDHAVAYWRQIVALLSELQSKKNMAIILIAHAKVERFEDPQYASYDRYTPRLHKSACALICEWSDAVLFATRRMRVDATTGKAAPVGADGGERIVCTNGSPACIAKNRFGLPSELPLSWTAFVEGLKAGGK